MRRSGRRNRSLLLAIIMVDWDIFLGSVLVRLSFVEHEDLLVIVGVRSQYDSYFAMRGL